MDGAGGDVKDGCLCRIRQPCLLGRQLQQSLKPGIVLPQLENLPAQCFQLRV